MRLMEFKMERQGLVTEGQKVEIMEGKLPTSYYYTILPAVAMSANFKSYERLTTTVGVVKEIKQTEKGYFVVVEFDE